MQPDTTVRRLSALAQTTRLEVFRRLLKRGRAGLRPQALMAELGIGGTALSFHLKALLRAGLIEGRQEQGGTRYRARPAALRELLEALAQDCCSADDDVCALDLAPLPNSAARVGSSSSNTDIQHAPA
jgi:ArsR family transcriptional regulator